MGRRVPGDNINISLQGPFLYYSLSFVGLVASIAIITALCSVRFRRKSPPPVPRTMSDPSEATKALNASSSPAEATTISISPEHIETTNTTELGEKIKDEVLLTKELPLPPAMQQPPNNKDSRIAKRATSERRLSFNLSMKMPRSLSVVRKDQKVKEEDDGGKKEKLKADESVWMKTIILGGKCVPDEEEDAVIYEGKGKKISAYHPRNSTSMSLSRQWSSIAIDSLSVPQPHSHDERINNI